jgi:DNA-binding transcriptional LysR family regulator
MGNIQVHRYKELRLGQLRAFCECVRYRSFTAAAKALGVSHASVWQQIRALEREYGVALLQRHGHEMTPTDDGRLLLEMASSVVSSVDSLKVAFEERRGKVQRLLTVIGTPGTIAEELSEPVVAFYRRHPNIRVQLSAHSRIPPLFDSLISGEADLGVLPLDEVKLASSDRIVEIERLCIRPAALVVPVSHPLAGRRRITLADIVRYPLILPEPETSWRLKVEEVLRGAGLLDRLQVLLEVTLTLAARRLVSLGLGAALLPLPQISLGYPNIRVFHVDRLLPAETIAIVWRRGATLRPQARLFIDFLRDQMSCPPSEMSKGQPG